MRVSPWVALLLLLSGASGLLVMSCAEPQPTGAASSVLTRLVYVSSSQGDDANSGAEGSPVRTLPIALRLSRRLRAGGVGGTILLASGDRWELRQPLRLDHRDHGLTIEAWHAESSRQSKPIISGGYTVPHWRRVGPKSVGNTVEAIWEATLPARARVLANTSSLYLSALGNRTAVPSHGTQHNGDPNSGPNLPSRRYRPRTRQFRWVSGLDPDNSSSPTNGRGFVFNSSDIPATWDLSPSALSKWRVFAYHSWDSSYHSVRSISRGLGEDTTKAVITFGEPATGPSYAGRPIPPWKNTGCNQRWYAENVPELPLVPGSGAFRLLSSDGGEWADHIQFAPTSADGSPSAGLWSAALPSLRQLIVIDGAFSVTIRGVALAHTFIDCPNHQTSETNSYLSATCDAGEGGGGYLMGPSAAIWLNDSALNFSLVDAEVRHTGGNGLGIRNSDRATVSHVLFQDLGFTAVEVEGSSHVSIRQNKMLRFGQEVASGNGVEISGYRFVYQRGTPNNGTYDRTAPASVNATIEHNEMAWGRHNHAINADCFNDTCRDTVVAFNHIHHVGREDETGLCDGGGLHMCCSNCTEAGNFVVNHNYVHHVSTFQHGGCGLYYDSGGSGLRWTNNVVHDVVSHTINWNGFGPKWSNRDHFHEEPISRSFFENNILIKNRANSFDNKSTGVNGQPLPALPDGNLGWLGYTPAVFRRNIVVTLPMHGVLKTPTSMFIGQACARRASPHCEPPSVDPEAQPCDTSCSDKYLDSFAHDNFSSNLYYMANAKGGVSSTFPGRCLECSNLSLHEWRSLGYDIGSIVADPLFVDVEQNDFRLQNDSPALAVGIQSIDVSLCGTSW